MSGAGDRAAGSIPAHDAIDVVLAHRAFRQARILHRERALPWRLDVDDGAGGLRPRNDAVLRVVVVAEEARVGDTEGTGAGRTAAGHHAHGFVPGIDAHVAAVKVVRHDQVVAQRAVLDRQLVEAAPVAAGLDEGQPHPRLPLQVRHAVHWPRGRVAGQRQAAEHLAHGAQRALGRLVEEGRHLFHVARDQQEALARLRQVADLAAVVGGLGDRVAVVAQQRRDLVE